MTKNPKRKPQNNYRSKWEIVVSKQIKGMGLPVNYETGRLAYSIPQRVSFYTPDFIVSEHNVIIEAKGIFDNADRKKHILLKQQYPKLKICLVFMNANQRIRKNSNTTYGQWCEKHSIPWSHKVVKKEWFTN